MSELDPKPDGEPQPLPDPPRAFDPEVQGTDDDAAVQRARMEDRAMVGGWISIASRWWLEIVSMLIGLTIMSHKIDVWSNTPIEVTPGVYGPEGMNEFFQKFVTDMGTGIALVLLGLGRIGFDLWNMYSEWLDDQE